MSDDDRSSLEDAIEQFLRERESGSAGDVRSFAARFPHLGRELEDALGVLGVLDGAARARPAGDEIPERVANFRVVREVGRGGMGVVLEAVEEPLGRRVALKVLPAEALSSPQARARFKREAELAARLDHSGIATVYGAGVEDERPWIAMRFVDGRTLAGFVAQARTADRPVIGLPRAAEKGLSDELAVAKCFAAVARALQYAHEHGVVHRDVKPSNVVVGSDGTPTLLDFGLALHEESSGDTLTRTGETAGTPAYFAPEIVNGECPRPDAQTDVYALGVSLYECLTTRRPFDGPTPMALYRAIGSGVASSPRVHNPSIPRDLAVVVATALERDRARRYVSAARLADDLEACVARKPIAARPVPLTGRLARWARREPRQALLASGFAIAGLGFASFAGQWWVTRGVVHAAEAVARTREREEALARAFHELRGADPALARRELEHVLALDPHSRDAHAGLAFIDLAMRRYQAALVTLEPMPNTRGFEALRATCKGQRVTQDAGLIADARATDEDFFLVGMSLVLEARRLPESQQLATNRRALAMLNEAVIRTRSPRLFHHSLRAEAARQARDERAARSAAGALVTLWPDSLHALSEAGTTLSDLDPEAAAQFLERALAMTDADPAPAQNLAQVYAAQNRLEDAERAAWRAWTINHLPECANTVGMALMMRGCGDEGTRAFETAFALDGRNYFCVRNLGQARLMEGNHEEARFLMEMLVQRDPLDALCHSFLADAFYALERDEECFVHMETALALDPTSGEAWRSYALRLDESGEREAARAAAEAGLALAPDHPRLRQAAQRILKAR